MGGLSRKLSYINTLKSNGTNPIILDAGDALFKRTIFSILELANAKYKAHAFLEAYEEIGCDALNIGEYDLTAGYEFLKSLEQNSTIPFISANLRVKETGDLAFKPFVIINRDSLKIGIIGVTDYLSNEVTELYKENYLKAGQKLIKILRDEVDILIMLVNSNVNQKNTILESFKDVDYVYLSRTVMNTRSSAPNKEGYPIFYTIGLNARYLIEVKTTIKDDKSPITDVSSFDTRLSSIARQLIRLKKTEDNQTIEEKYASRPQVLMQIESYEKQVKELEASINKVINSSEIRIVALPKSMEYDVEMQSFIEKAL
ncbi:MAG: hypothetical protein GWP19_05575, partial [Planctomycetia bacterium]|nr:hypothetical protein [Planctomycetia bacterium]